MTEGHLYFHAEVLTMAGKTQYFSKISEGQFCLNCRLGGSDTTSFCFYDDMIEVTVKKQFL